MKNNYKSLIKGAAILVTLMSTSVFANTTIIDSYHEVELDPETGANIYVQTDIAQIDGVDVNGYDKFYPLTTSSEGREIETGQRLIHLTCFVSLSDYPGGSGNSSTISTVIEENTEYELYSHLEVWTVWGGRRVVACYPGLKIKH